MLRRTFAFTGIRTRLISIYVFISVIPILLISTLTYDLSSVYLTRRITMLIDNNLTQVKRNIETHIEGYRYLLYQAFSDESLVSLIRGFETGDGTEKAIIKNHLKTRLFSLAFNKEEIQAITFIWNDLDIVGYDKGIGDFYESPFSDLSERALLYHVGSDEPNGTVLSTKALSYTTKTPKEKNLFHLPLRFYDFKEKRILGVLTLSVDEHILTDICSGAKDSLVFIVDEEGRVVSFPTKSCIGEGIVPDGPESGKPASALSDEALAAFVNKTGILPRGKILVNRLAMTNPGWTLVSAVNRDVFFSEVDALERISFFLMGGFILVSLLVIVLFAENFSRAVSELVAVMGSAQNGHFVKAERLEHRKDEFSLLAKGYNDMISEIRELMRKLEREKDNLYVATQKQKESEIRALEAQINPHFLYNTLDCINWMAIEKNEYEISSMLSNLGLILRYGINKSNAVVSVAEEVEWLRQYVYLQQVRFENIFTFELEVDPGIQGFRLYKLLMQPFIENAIIHGFADLEGGGVLKVAIEPDGTGGLSILIVDNGRGMGPDEVRNALSNESSHIGISNVRERMAVYYGELGSLDIESEPHGGTRVRIILPRIGGDS